MGKTKEQKIMAWKMATREAVNSMHPSGFVEMPGNKFLVMFDRELTAEEIEKAQILKFQDFGKAYMYSYNSKAKMRGIIRMFDAEIMALWDSVIIYDKEVDVEMLKGIPNLKFKFKAFINLYEIDYQTPNK